jgi:hypothetical protein
LKASGIRKRVIRKPGRQESRKEKTTAEYTEGADGGEEPRIMRIETDE